jgi:hypothetical protein
MRAALRTPGPGIPPTSASYWSGNMEVRWMNGAGE